MKPDRDFCFDTTEFVVNYNTAGNHDNNHSNNKI